MAIKNLFKHGRRISRNLLSRNYRNDRVIRNDIMSDPKLKKVLDRPEEQKELHDKMLEKAADGSITGDEMREIAYDLTHGGGKNISNEEGRAIAREIFSDSSRRYKAPDPEPQKSGSDNANTKNTSESSQTAKVTPAYFAHRATERQSSYQSDLNKHKGRSYFDTLRRIISRQN